MTDIWTAAAWAAKREQKPASPVPPPSTATANPVLIKAPSPAAPALIPAPTKNAPAFGIKQVVNPATTGMQAPKPVPPSAQAPINIPAPAPVTPVAPALPVAESILPVVALPDTYGV